MTDSQTSIAIIGGGPAGLMAAEYLAGSGHAVTLFEKMPTLGRKFLMAGRGGLNLTHSEDADRFRTRYGEAAEWVWPFIEAFTPADLQTWCEDLDQETFVGSSGRLFPAAMKASPLLRAWQARLVALGVDIRVRHAWTGWTDAGALNFETPDGAQSFQADAVILALGGASWPRLGADGGWTDLLRDKGSEIADFRASNCGVEIAWSDLMRHRHAGEPLKSIGLTVDGQSVVGEGMISDYGLEGGAIYALSAAIRDALDREGRARLSVDLRPNESRDNLAGRLARARKGESLSTMLRKRLKLAPQAASLLREEDRALSRDPVELAGQIKSTTLEITAQRGLDRAISSAGGVMRSSVDDRLMLKAMPGVFLAGEMLDWDAPTGGYLLQACFSTGLAAAKGAEKWLSAEGR